MKYDSDIHHRRSIRLRDYDYSQVGAYFVTICSPDRQLLFGDIDDEGMLLNPIGEIIHNQWETIPQRFPLVELDEFVIMPNHVHAIFIITTVVGPPLAGAIDPINIPIDENRATARVAPTVGDIVGAYKSLCAHHCLQWVKHNDPDRILGKLWQRNYWEHIVRDESEMNNIREYVQHNPAKWHSDKLFVFP